VPNQASSHGVPGKRGTFFPQFGSVWQILWPFLVVTISGGAKKKKKLQSDQNEFQF
jgi:hypothetical protein